MNAILDKITGSGFGGLSPELLVANSVLSVAFSKGVAVTHLKLQKLVYFVYKKYLKDTGYALFAENFEVWTYGPVLPSVYRVFRKYGSGAIDDFAYPTFRLDRKAFVVARAHADFYAALDWVWAVYGGFGAMELVDITHREGTAWSIADSKKSAFMDDKDISREEWAYA